jgi:hypothetical protein
VNGATDRAALVSRAALRATLGSRAALLAIALLGSACSTNTPAGGGDGAWVGTITTEGNLTTVVNEAGSVWGGPATLVEEASIGVESGPDEYMFGNVPSVWATEDRILVLDTQIPTVRVYDLDGNHLFDVGRRGEGPGEFTQPAGVAVTRGGDILVIESSTQIEVFAADGTPKDTWNTGSMYQVGTLEMLILGTDDAAWVPAFDMENGRLGRARIGADGTAGEPMFPTEPERQFPCLTYTRSEREYRYCAIPFQPFSLSTLTPEGAWLLGTNDTYSFEIRRTDGSTLRIERYWTPVPVTAGEAAYRKESTTQNMRERIAREPSWTWNGPEIPDHKPAYRQLWPDRNGRIWVLREGPSRLSTECVEDVPECWVPELYWLDAFASDGRFLGSATIDRFPYSRPFIDGTTFLAIEIDEAGTITVKRYRMMLPS